MKKIISIVLLCTMLLACFAGCGAKKGQIDLNAYGSNVNVEDAGYTAPTVGNGEGNVEVALQFDGSKAMNTYTVDALESAAADVSWKTDADTYTLDSAADVLGFFTEIQAGTTFAGKVINLAANVDLEGAKLLAGDAAFAGTFNGQGYFISGIHLFAGGRGEVSLFGKVGVNVDTVIKNVSIINSSVNVVAVGSVDNEGTKVDETGDSVNVGGLISSIGNYAETAADADLGTLTIDNIYADIDVYYVQAKPTYNDSGVATAGTFAGQNRVGGIVGWVNSSVTNLSNIVFVGTVESTGNNVSGLFGRVASTKGKTTCNISNCKNAGTMTAIGSFFVGGKQEHSIAYVEAYKAGMAANSYTSDLVITTTIDQESKTTTYTASKIDLSAKIQNWGGVIGENGGAATTTTITNCENNATITGNANIAGIVGQMTNGILTIDGCINKAPMTTAGNSCAAGILGKGAGIKVIIRNCQNTADATISTTGGKKYAGGIVASISTVEQALVDNCTNNAAVSAAGYAAGIVGGFLSQIYAGDYNITVSNCTNTGNVTATDNVAGGIVGTVMTYNGTEVSTIKLGNTTYNVKKTGSASGGKYDHIASTIAEDAKIEIKNCTVSGCTLSFKKQAGGILGYAKVSTSNVDIVIDNCTFAETATIEAVQMAAGIFGYSDKSSPITVTNCTMAGTLTSTGRACGGIGGYWQSAAVIDNCDVTGTVSVTLEDVKNNAGAAFLGRTLGNLTVTNSNFTGSFTITCNPAAISGSDDNTCYTGVVVGYANKDVTVENCNLTGSYAVVSTSNVATKSANSYAIINGYKNSEKVNTVTNVATNLSSCTITEGKTIKLNALSPVVVGYQTRANEKDATATDLRIVAALNGLQATEGVGFVVTIKIAGQEDKVQTVYANKVFSAIKDEEETLYKASDFKSEYLATLVIEGIPASFFTEGKLTGAQIIVTPTIATSAEAATNGCTYTYGVAPVVEQ